MHNQGVGSIFSNPEIIFIGVFSVESHEFEFREARQFGISLDG